LTIPLRQTVLDRIRAPRTPAEIPEQSLEPLLDGQVALRME
jgi:hypothetical protein